MAQDNSISTPFNLWKVIPKYDRLLLLLLVNPVHYVHIYVRYFNSVSH